VLSRRSFQRGWVDVGSRRVANEMNTFFTGENRGSPRQLNHRPGPSPRASTTTTITTNASAMPADGKAARVARARGITSRPRCADIIDAHRLLSTAATPASQIGLCMAARNTRTCRKNSGGRHTRQVTARAQSWPAPRRRRAPPVQPTRVYEDALVVAPAHPGHHGKDARVVNRRPQVHQ